jgi:hypothetical protein
VTETRTHALTHACVDAKRQEYACKDSMLWDLHGYPSVISSCGWAPQADSRGADPLTSLPRHDDHITHSSHSINAIGPHHRLLSCRHLMINCRGVSALQTALAAVVVAAAAAVVGCRRGCVACGAAGCTATRHRTHLQQSGEACILSAY